MINEINQLITALTTFPQRSSYTSSDAYAQSVENWLNELKTLSNELSVLVPELQGFTTELNLAIAQIEDDKTAISEDMIDINDAVNTLQGVVATLPDGTINDNITTSTDTWSSSKLSKLIEPTYIRTSPTTQTLPLNPNDKDVVRYTITNIDDVTTFDGNGETITLKDGIGDTMTAQSLITLTFTFDIDTWRIS